MFVSVTTLIVHMTMVVFSVVFFLSMVVFLSLVVLFRSGVSLPLQNIANLYSLKMPYSTAALKSRMAYFILFCSILVLLQMLLSISTSWNSLIRKARRVLQYVFGREVRMKIWVKFIIQETAWNCIQSFTVALHMKGVNWHFGWK